MHEIFVNYRTKGGKEVAYMCEHHLSARFGPDSVFLARYAIAPGDTMDALLRASRRCHVLLVLIDAEWMDAPHRDEPGKRALDDPDDWVRREIEQALSGGALIVPVFIGRKVEQLDPRRLPRSITELADYQYTRVEVHRIEEDLTSLGDRLVRRVPALAALDSRKPAQASRPAERAAGVHNEHQSGGIGQVGGSVGTYINDARGPLHTGPGNQINGDGTNYVGDNQGGIRQGFGTRTPRGGEDR
ncbi:TIR domain-containing protein [Streptomyces sp. NPDC020489]|uniref:TIR domain-containing protein n=1 Tax=Streptomyces sp. NPDC020489 TaxID=3365077 RepID=UPI0037B2B70D